MTQSTISPPACEVTAAQYDRDCHDALAGPLDELLDLAERAGWARGRAASALMYLAAKRLNTPR